MSEYIYTQDNENGAGGSWSANANVTATVDGQKVHGIFDKDNRPIKIFDVPTAADGYTITFDFYELGSWDNEDFEIVIDGKIVTLGSFTGGTNDDSDNAKSGTTTDGIEWSYTSEQPRHLSGTSGYMDQIHHVTLWVPRTAISGSQMTLEFDAKLNSAVNDEAFALDNLAITADYIEAPELARPDLVEIVREGFDNGASGWSNTNTTTLGNAGAVLGKFSGAQDVSKTFKVPVGVEGYNISFDFLEIDSWDGERFQVTINGKTVDLGLFTHNSNEQENDDFGVTADGIEWKFTSQTRKNFAAASSGNQYADQIHHVNLWVPESLVYADEITVTFDAQTNSGIADESYAIDNFAIATPAFDRTLIVQERFNDGASGWNLNNTHVLGGLGEVLGRFNGSQDVQKTFDVPASADGIEIKFDFIEIDSWDNEDFYVYVDGKAVNLGAFQVYSDESENTKLGQTTDGIYWSYSSGALIQREGSNATHTHWKEQVHEVTLKVPRSAITGDQVTLKFDARTNGGTADESYAIDNLEIRALGQFVTRAPGIVDTRAYRDVLVEDDFQNTNEGWTPGQTAQLGEAGNYVLGEYFNGASASKTIQLDDVSNDGVTVEFDLYEMNNWAGGKLLIKLNGTTIDLGGFTSTVDEDLRTGISEGVFWRTNSTEAPHFMDAGNSGNWHLDQIHSVGLWVPRELILANNGSLEIEIDPETSTGDSFAIDNFMVLDGFVGAVDQNGYSAATNRGSTLDVGERLYRGEALVSDDERTALFIDDNGMAWVMHDADNNGTMESISLLFASQNWSKPIWSIQLRSNGNLVAQTDDYTWTANTGTNGSGHVGHRIRVEDGRVTTEEKDGSAIYTASHDGVRKLVEDDARAKIFTYDNLRQASDGWTKADGLTDPMWLSGFGEMADHDTTHNGFVTSESGLSRTVLFDSINQEKPTIFEFEIGRLARRGIEDISISIGDMNGNFHTIGLGELATGSGNSYAQGSTAVPVIAWEVEELTADGTTFEKMFKVTLTAENGLELLPTFGGLKLQAETGLKYQSATGARIHIQDDNVQSDEANIGLMEFAIKQHSTLPGLSTPTDLSEFISLISLTDLTFDATDLTADQNDINQELTQLSSTLSALQQRLNGHNTGDFDLSDPDIKFAFAQAMQSVEQKLISLVGDVDEAGSLSKYASLYWDILNTVENPKEAVDYNFIAGIGGAIGFVLAMINIVLDPAVGAFAVAGAVATDAVEEEAPEVIFENLESVRIQANLPSGEEGVVTGDAASLSVNLSDQSSMQTVNLSEGTGVGLQSAGTSEWSGNSFDAVGMQEDPIQLHTQQKDALAQTSGYKKLFDATISATMFSSGFWSYITREGKSYNMIDSWVKKAQYNMPATFEDIVETFAYLADESGDQDLIDGADDLEAALGTVLYDLQNLVSNATAATWIVHNLPDEATPLSAVQHRPASQTANFLDEELFWEGLGFDAVVSDQSKIYVQNNNETQHRAKITVTDGTDGMGADLLGVDSFSYWVEGFVAGNTSGFDPTVRIQKSWDLEIDMTV